MLKDCINYLCFPEFCSFLYFLMFLQSLIITHNIIRLFVKVNRFRLQPHPLHDCDGLVGVSLAFQSLCVYCYGMHVTRFPVIKLLLLGSLSG